MHVVILAYGPAQITKRAAGRARNLAGKRGTVVAVAASAAGSPAVRNLAGITVAEKAGRAGLREIFETLPEGPTLLIHDDVVLTPKSARAMVRELDTGSRYVIPYSNDRDVDHFFGALPAEKGAERKLDQIAAPRQSRPAAKVRPACVLARTTHLEALMNQPLADPLSLLNGSIDGFVVASGALASHATRCIKRMVPDDPEGRPLLVAALIVKDEEDMLPGCLESLQPLVDRIEVCDTGSTDATIAIAEAAGARVTQREWPNDFAVARNYVLEQCRDARYVLQVDADERVECAQPAQMRRYLATYSAEHPALSVEITNIDSSGAARNRFSNVRIFHATDTEFRGAVHEAVFPVGGTDPLPGTDFAQLRIDHYGYAESIITGKDKAQRNVDLAEAGYLANPDARSALHLARSLKYADQSPERALAMLEEAWAGSGNATPTGKAQILGLMADHHATSGDDDRAFDLSREAVLLVPADDTATALLATTAERLGRFEEFIEVAESIADRLSATPAHRVDANRAIFRSALARAYARVGESEKAVAEAYDVLSEYPERFDGWDLLVECLNGNYGSAAVELLAPLAAKDPIGTFLEPTIKTFPSAVLSDFCVRYRAAGGVVPEVTRVGLLASAMAGKDTNFSALAPAAAELDPLVRVGLADRIAANGRPDLAAELRAEPVVLRL